MCYMGLMYIRYSVKLGNSGLKVSKIILGCMQYGDTRNAAWYLDEAEAIKHIKAAYVNSMQEHDLDLF